MKKLIVLLALLMSVTSAAYAQTSITQYIDTATGCGGNDGTIGNPYCTCAEWEAQDTDLVSADQTLTVISTGAGTTGCTIEGWTTDATRRIVLDGPVITTTGYNEPAITIDVANVTLRNARLVRSGSDINIRIFQLTGAAGTSSIIERSSFVATGVTRDSGVACVAVGGLASSNITFRNNVIIDCPGSVTNALEMPLFPTSTYNVNNNTVVNSANKGIVMIVETTPTGSIVNLNNNLSYNNTGVDYEIIPGAATLNQLTNLSEDATSPTVAFRSKTITFVDAAAKNFRLAAGDTEALNVGTTIASFSNDFDGDTRPQGAGWDIGFDERLAGSTNRFMTLLKVGL